MTVSVTAIVSAIIYLYKMGICISRIAFLSMKCIRRTYESVPHFTDGIVLI